MILRPDLKKIEKSYNEVLKNWKRIDDDLDRLKIGRKDTPFDETVRDNMLLAWEYLDYIISKKGHCLLSQRGGSDMLEINNIVHYGVEEGIRREYCKAIEANQNKFTSLIPPIRKYYEKHMVEKEKANKVAAEIFIAILGMPQLYIEGNHRAGSIVASWINLVHGLPPFVLTVENASAYFEPAQAIKKFDTKSVWRSMTKLPKYKKDFKRFWVENCDMRFAKKE